MILKFKSFGRVKLKHFKLKLIIDLHTLVHVDYQLYIISMGGGMICWLQLTENARKWGKERSELLVRLQEAEHGLRGSPLTMTSYPRIVSLQQL